MARLTDVIGWIGANGKRIAVTVVGFALIALGLVLLVLPGPGILVVLAGLAVLATQYAWARSALDEVKRRTSGATKRFRRRQPES
jgi:uncharacterized protein (TIGR02611 family)